MPCPHPNSTDSPPESFAQASEDLLSRITNGAHKYRAFEQAFAENPPPNLDLILNVYRTFIFEAATRENPAPECLKIADRLTRTISTCQIGQANLDLKERKVKIAEEKAAREKQSNFEKALTYCLAEAQKYPEMEKMFKEAFAGLKPKVTPPETTPDITRTADEALGGKKTKAPDCTSFKEFLANHARVANRTGMAVPFSMRGRAPLELVADWTDKILRNTLDGEAVEIDGVTFSPAKLKGASFAVAGGAQFGKTIIELNLMAYATAIRFISVGNYLPDRPKVEEIVGQKFRPNVLDLYPWMAEMIQMGKVENASGKTIDRKESYTVTDGTRKSFGSFCGMHKPPTSITIDIALLDEVDDIPDRNIGYVDGRMTNSPVHLTCFIGTQRIAGAGQNARLASSSFHVKLYRCPECGKEWNLEENFPRCVRSRRSGNLPEISPKKDSPIEPLNLIDYRALPGGGGPSGVVAGILPAVEPGILPGGKIAGRQTPLPSSQICSGVHVEVHALDPILAAESGHDRNAHYYCACPECGRELDRDGGRYVAKHPERIAEAKLGVRVSQLTISAISLQEIVGAWFAAMMDPSGEAMRAFYCDRVGIPNAGAAQPITQKVLDGCRALGGGAKDSPQPYDMSLGVGATPRFAGLDTGPRCWFWCDEQPGDSVSNLIWAEMIASGNATARIPQLMDALNVSCLFIDAGGEPDLTKRLVLALNGLENLPAPERSHADLLRSKMTNLGIGLSWDGERGCWSGLKAAAVLFVAGEAKGIQQTIGFTQEGKMYPLIKCHRGESIQTAVNDFLTPADGVLEMMGLPGKQSPRVLPRARLPRTCTGAGVSQAVLDGHLLNLRKERDVKTGREDWLDGVQNHLGLAKVYARLAVTAGSRRAIKVAFSKTNWHTRQQNAGNLGMGNLNASITL